MDHMWGMSFIDKCILSAMAIIGFIWSLPTIISWLFSKKKTESENPGKEDDPIS